jgi:hypothetical protein
VYGSVSAYSVERQKGVILISSNSSGSGGTGGSDSSGSCGALVVVVVLYGVGGEISWRR